MELYEYSYSLACLIKWGGAFRYLFALNVLFLLFSSNAIFIFGKIKNAE